MGRATIRRKRRKRRKRERVRSFQLRVCSGKKIRKRGVRLGELRRFYREARMSARRPKLFFSHVLQGKELGKTRFASVGTAGVIGGLE